MPEPWEQLRGEPKESYCRFLFYRNLGPGRSLNLAYRTYLNTIPVDPAQPGNALKGVKPRRAPANWLDDSSRYRWTERAVEWDIAQLERIGIDVAPLWAGILRASLVKSAQKFAQPSFKPTNWRDAHLILTFLTADVIQALCPPKTPEPSATAGDRSTLGRTEPADKPVPPPEPTRESVE
jgi:hypothetical protein